MREASQPNESDQPISEDHKNDLDAGTTFLLHYPKEAMAILALQARMLAHMKKDKRENLTFGLMTIGGDVSDLPMMVCGVFESAPNDGPSERTVRQMIQRLEAWLEHRKTKAAKGMN